MASISRALPSGGPTTVPVGVPPLSLHAVDKPNPSSKFGHKAPSKSNNSTVFNSGPSPSPRFGKRCPAGGNGGRSAEATPRSTLKITQGDRVQAAAARYREDHPRFGKKPATADSDKPPVDTSRILTPSKLDDPMTPSPGRRPTVMTMNGLEYSGGRKPAPQKHQTTMERASPSKAYASMERFKHSDRTATPKTDVLKPETLPTHVPEAKVQRFRSSPSARHSSLVGVFGADPAVRAPPTYTPRAPYHTD